MKLSQEQKKRRTGVWLLFTIVVFTAMLLNTIVSGVMLYFMAEFEVLTIDRQMGPHVTWIIIRMALISLPVGLLLSWIATKIPLKPIQRLVDGMNKLAAGNYKTRLRAGTIVRYYPGIAEVTDSFNTLARELENTEMLRSDFINNFSHEFKTPIVSIAGFAKLLKRANLTDEQKQEYISIIEEESLRLAAMATNVLNLTKVENQTILTDVSNYNLSEQLRSCILLLEDKWTKKDLDFLLCFGEHNIEANEELLKQVWINLLDNAIKFSPDKYCIEICINEQDDTVSVSILNCGSEISPEEQQKIFNKFYQADTSHATQGNGVGLSIVKQVVELHGGEVTVSSKNAVTVFTVTLPK